MVICDTGLCEGEDYELLVQFEASPEPEEVGKSFHFLIYFYIFRFERVSMAESDLKWLKTGGMGDAGKWQPEEDRGEC